MSERGSFVTEYIHCDHCLAAVREVLISDHKFLCSQPIISWSETTPSDLPVIAGKVGGLYQGEELNYFELEIIPELSKRVCHSLRIAVLAEVGERIFTVEPIK